MSEISSTTRSSSRTALLKDQVKRENQERQRNILHLIYKYLNDHNLHITAEALENEALTSNLHFQVCDNIDLEIILQEYQSYYSMKYQKAPTILRKMVPNEELNKKRISGKSRTKKTEIAFCPSRNDSNNCKDINNKKEFEINITPLTNKDDDLNDKLTVENPLIDFENYSGEWKEIALQIMKQVVPKNLGVSWKDCIGLENTIELLKEAAVYPIIYSEVFSNIAPWKGILLYGPPGTGKTLLAKALACESPAMVINVTSSTIISKWRGESEKLVKVLFDISKYYAPTIIFFDEIDALASTNKESHHEASRRFKSELLTQIDGILPTENLFILATTNSPWDIDSALLRRFEKRIFVPLPDENTKYKIFQYYIKNFNSNITKDDGIKCTKLFNNNYSGSDIQIVCKEANMIIIREKIANLKLDNKQQKIQKSRELTITEIKAAIDKLKPCIQQKDYEKFVDWCTKFGSI